MGTVSKNPLRQAGACVNSGNINTGEIASVRGGGQAFTVWSGNAFLSGLAPSLPGAAGAGYDVLLYSGAGRLNSILPLLQLSSGLGVLFYDAAVATSGGPFAASGHKVVGILPPTYPGGAVSGAAATTVGYNGQPLNVDLPFQSGLCIALKSGQVGFTISWSPESNPSSGGVQN